jgi:hypothetical protein
MSIFDQPFAPSMSVGLWLSVLGLDAASLGGGAGGLGSGWRGLQSGEMELVVGLKGAALEGGGGCVVGADLGG